MIKYFKGFNGLRFFAAFIVLISHGYQSVVKQNFILPEFMGEIAFFDKGGAAVDFFFTLSGFLITYLLIREQNETKTISIKKFYLRRVMRIWPLYFLILIVGTILITVVYPLFSGEQFLPNNDAVNVVLLYIIFLPNLASSLYKVGVLYPLWSIGVEEQFYLIWAPLVKFFKAKILPAASILFILSFIIYLLPYLTDLTDTTTQFLKTLRFSYMSIGAFFAVFVYKQGMDKLAKNFINNSIMRVVIPFLILGSLLVKIEFVNTFLFNGIIAILYSILLIQVFTAKRSWVNLEHKWLKHLGAISYGIYMYHLTVDYVFRALSLKLKLSTYINNSILYLIFYIVLILGVTVLISHLSLKYFENFFLKIKHKKYTV